MVPTSLLPRLYWPFVDASRSPKPLLQPVGLSPKLPRVLEAEILP